MPAKGSIAKEQIMKSILNLLGEDAFSPDGKEIRVDYIEAGSPVQIKISLTAVKSPILNTPKSEVINEEQFQITDEERAELENTLTELGVEF